MKAYCFEGAKWAQLALSFISQKEPPLGRRFSRQKKEPKSSKKKMALFSAILCLVNVSRRKTTMYYARVMITSTKK